MEMELVFNLILYNITLSQQGQHRLMEMQVSFPRRTMTTLGSNDTLVDTSFRLISDFFHVNQGV